MFCLKSYIRVKTKNEKEHNMFVHIDDNTFACKHQRSTVLTSRIQKEAQARSQDCKFGGRFSVGGEQTYFEYYTILL